MASEANVKINLKTVAQTGDAEKLVALIKALGETLKKTGGADAKELRNNLAPMLKELARGDISADRVKSMAGQVAKIKALGSASALNGKLAQICTAQARIVQRTIDDIRAAIEKGDLSENAIDDIGKSLEKFVAEANKLPPAGLKKLGKDINNTIESTYELQGAIAAISGIDFKVSGGSGSLEELAHKLQVISEAKDLDEGVKELEAAIQDLSPENAEEIGRQLERIQEVLNGDLGAKGAKELDKIMKEVSRTCAKLGGSDLGKISAALSRVTASGQSLGQTMRKTGNAAADSFNLAESAASMVGVRVGEAEGFVTGLLSKIPKIGPMISSLAGPIGLLLAALTAGIGKVLSWFAEMRDARREFTFKQFTSGLENAHKIMEASIHALERQQELTNSLVEAERSRADALNDLTKAQIALNKARELEGVEDSAERTRIEEKYSRMESDHEFAVGRLGHERNIEDLDRQIEQLEDRLKEAEEDAEIDKAGARLSHRYAQMSARKAVAGSWAEFFKLGWLTGSTSDREYAAQHGENAVNYQNALTSKLESIDKMRNDLKALEAKRTALWSGMNGGGKSPTETRLEAEKAQREAEARDREATERRRVESIRRQRARDEEIFMRDEADAERSHRRSVAEPYQDIVTHLQTAEKELARFSLLEDKAAAKRKRVMADFLASGRAEMTEAERFAFDSASSDLSYARSGRRSEQSTIASLRKQLRDRRVDKEFSDYEERREDYEWRRQGRYSRANYAVRLRMDEERYEEGVRQFEAAEARIRAANAGTRVLTPEERRLVERDRAEGRRKMTESRESIRSALYTGDETKAGFVANYMRSGNRLTQMGLGGNVANWERKTADNTRRLVEQTREILASMNKTRLASATWGM